MDKADDFVQKARDLEIADLRYIVTELDKHIQILEKDKKLNALIKLINDNRDKLDLGDIEDIGRIVDSAIHPATYF